MGGFVFFCTRKRESVGNYLQQEFAVVRSPGEMSIRVRRPRPPPSSLATRNLQQLKEHRRRRPREGGPGFGGGRGRRRRRRTIDVSARFPVHRLLPLPGSRGQRNVAPFAPFSSLRRKKRKAMDSNVEWESISISTSPRSKRDRAINLDLLMDGVSSAQARGGGEK